MSSALVDNLAQLQNLLKRDPESYKDEFMLQYRCFLAEFELHKLQPGRESDSFRELLLFLGQVVSFFKEACDPFVTRIFSLLDESARALHPQIRLALCQAIITLRSRKVVGILQSTKQFFKLLAVEDKHLREMLIKQIVNDIQKSNTGTRDERTNRDLQAFLFKLLEEEDASSKHALRCIVELYRRKIWYDARTVNVISTACVSERPGLFVPAIQFFLHVQLDKKRAGDDSSDDEGIAPVQQKKSAFADLPVRAHSRQAKKQLRAALRSKRKSIKINHKNNAAQFPAIQLIHDPQRLAERLFGRVKKGTDKFDVRLLLMSFISRLIGQHKLVLLNFYSFVQRYLAAHQQNVTDIFSFLIQACHEHVPPAEVLPIVKLIADNFINERCSPEAVQVGINAFREVVLRCPSVLHEEDLSPLLQDLVQYRKSHEKEVKTAARSLLNLIRELHPGALKRKDRGKDHTRAVAPDEYGASRAAHGVLGAALLDREEGDGEDEWEMASDDSGSDDSDDWVDLSDNEPAQEEVAPKKKQKRGPAGASAEGEEEGDDDEGSSDGDEDGEEAPMLVPLEESRILTPKDFERLQKNIEVKAAKGKSKQGAQFSAVVHVDPTEIESSIALRRRRDAERMIESKMQKIQKYSGKDRGGGTTNTEKNRKKQFLMLAKSQGVQGKLKKSLNHQQKNLKKHLENLNKQVRQKRRRG